MRNLSFLILLLSLSFALETTAIVTKVTDGDTLHITVGKEDVKIRILYIDTPEKYGGAKLDKDAKKAGISTKDEQDLGQLSSAYASKFFQKGDTVIINSDKKDQYGRTLGTVKKNGIDYSTQIIKDGYACIYKKTKYPKELDSVLQNAKDGKKGLWSINYEVMSKLCK